MKRVDKPEVVFIRSHGPILYTLYKHKDVEGFVFVIADWNGTTGETKVNFFGCMDQEWANGIIEIVGSDRKTLYMLYDEMQRVKGRKPKDLGTVNGPEVDISEIVSGFKKQSESMACQNMKN